MLNVFIYKRFTTHELIRSGDWYFLGYDVVSFSKQVPAFRQNLLRVCLK